METDHWVELTQFHTAIEATTACHYLEQASIPFDLTDYNLQTQGADRLREGPAVWLIVSVEKPKVKSAQAVLRASMGLFPERETAKATGDEDSTESLVQVVSCETFAESEEMKVFLGGSAIHSEIRELREEDELIAYSVEVKESDLDRAFHALESWPE